MIRLFERPCSPAILGLISSACAAVSSGGDGIASSERGSELFRKRRHRENGVVVREGALRFEQSVARQVLLDRSRR